MERDGKEGIRWLRYTEGASQGESEKFIIHLLTFVKGASEVHRLIRQTYPFPVGYPISYPTNVLLCPGLRNSSLALAVTLPSNRFLSAVP